MAQPPWTMVDHWRSDGYLGTMTDDKRRTRATILGIGTMFILFMIDPNTPRWDNPHVVLSHAQRSREFRIGRSSEKDILAISDCSLPIRRMLRAYIKPCAAKLRRHLASVQKRTMSRVPEEFLADKWSPIVRLKVKEFYNDLSLKEKLYAHYMSLASFAGTRIILEQTNPDGNTIYDLILTVFTNEQGSLADVEQLKRNSGIEAEAFDDFVQYCSQFLGNLSNYRAFADKKFIPRCSEHDVEAILQALPEGKAQKAQELFAKVRKEIFSYEPQARNLLGFPDEGHLSGYYTQNMTQQDMKIVQDCMEKHDIYGYNTRLFKDSANQLRLLVACAEKSPDQTFELADGRTLQVIYGDFAVQMKVVAENIKKAIPYAANEEQAKMLEHYHKSFLSGSIEEHKESQKWWVKDPNPRVESNIGFIETYRDPLGTRAEWQGFVAVVNQPQSRKYAELVNKASTFIPELPWGKYPYFERETFHKPAFTSLEVLSFCTSEIPAGINIPNYPNFETKNVSLGNILNARPAGIKTTFIHKDDLELYEKYRDPSFEVQVGLHELLGHGTGNLLMENADCTKNFGDDAVHPLTGGPIETWYKKGQTFGSVFGNLASSYEECRAECVAMVLTPNQEVLDIFGYTGQEADDVVYASYLNMARAGLNALQFYDPEDRKWGQAHMRARFAIFQLFLKCGDDFCRIEEDPENDTVYIRLDRTKIITHALPSVNNFLRHLQVYRSTADVKEGGNFFMDATRVSEEWLRIRDIVWRNRQPRRVDMQGNTVIEKEGEAPVLVEYEETPLGVIQSYIERAVA